MKFESLGPFCTLNVILMGGMYKVAYIIIPTPLFFHGSESNLLALAWPGFFNWGGGGGQSEGAKRPSGVGCGRRMSPLTRLGDFEI